MSRSVASYIRAIPDHPEPGILFRDITGLLESAEGFRTSIDLLAERYGDAPFDVVAGIEARGFIFGSALAYELRLPFVPIRKAGKLPGQVVGVDYELEYGSDRLEVHVSAFAEGAQVLLVDDLIATGGTVAGALDLVTRLGATCEHAGFVVDLPDLGGSTRLRERGVEPFSLCSFAGG